MNKSIAEEILKLTGLRDSNSISAEEFDKAKKLLLEGYEPPKGSQPFSVPITTSTN